MWFRRYKAWLPPANTGPISFSDWTEKDIDHVSAAIRRRGQPDSDGFRRFALVALNTLRGGSAVELVARAMEASANPGCDPERPIEGNHYMRGMPAWCVWIEYAIPAVASCCRQPDKQLIQNETPAVIINK